MKHVKALFILVLSLLVLASCGGGDEPGPTPTNLHTVTFNPNGGEIINGASSIQVQEGTEFNQCSTPMVRQVSKVFKDWTFDAAGTSKVEPTFKINQDVTIYAHLADEYHTITFDANGGQFIGSPQTTFTVKEGTKLSTIDIPKATDEFNSAYVGWANDEDGDNSVTLDYQIESDVTLYAQYSNEALVVDEPEDIEILSYGSTAIGYHLYDLNQTVVAASSKTPVLTVLVDSAHSAVIVDSTGNWVDSVTVTVGTKSNVNESSYTITTRHPKSAQEAGECIDYALGRRIYYITLTFDYNNKDTFEYFLSERIETRLIAPYYRSDTTEWHTGTGVINKLYLVTDSKMATKSKDISQPTYSKYYYKNLKNAAYEIRHSKIQKRTEDHFAIDDAKKRFVVHNSETLFFALERGFRPEFIDSEIAVNGSLAQRAYFVYQEARSACAEAFGTETTNDFDKVRQLFEWLMNNTHYDHWIVSNEATEVEDFWQWSSYFAEGVFLNNGIAVCDGFSKALAIMGGIEGLPIIRSAGFADAGGHAWNYYHHSDNEWYLICPTWAHDDNDASDSEIFNYNYSVTTYQPFMAESKYFYNHIYKMRYNYYKDQGATDWQADIYAKADAKGYNFNEVLFSDITKSADPYASDIYTTDIFDSIQGYDYHLDSNDEADALVNAIKGLNLKTDFSVDISYFDEGIEFAQHFINKLFDTLPGVKAVGNLVEYTLTHIEILVKF